MKEETHFEPVKRTGKENIISENAIVTSQKYFTDIFGTINGVGAVLNKNRQIVYANNEYLSLMGIDSLDVILGSRPGEVVSCIHSNKSFDGCGTSQECSVCGAVNTILESQKTHQKITGEARLTSKKDGHIKSWDLKVTTAPITFSGEPFYIFMLEDISAEKRRQSLEQIFFHDILNLAGGLNGLLTVLKSGIDPEEAREIINMSEESSRNLIEEIRLHKQIMDAENGDLKVRIEKLNSCDFLASVIDKIKYHDIAKSRKIIIDEYADQSDFESDRVVLQNVIINLLKNALEATPEDGTVRAGCKSSYDTIIFWVQNSGIISLDIQMQIFQRSFSTKGKGRGTGTYSVRLLTENYLKGNISFVSNEYEGTIFTVELNKIFPAD
jgi:hypothetical protein